MTEKKEEGQKKEYTKEQQMIDQERANVRRVKEQIKELQEKLAEVIKEKDELFSRLQRLSADYSNFQKRSVKQTAETVCFENERIIKSLLPPLDDFERIIKNAAATPENPDAIIKGIRIVYDHILDILKSHDVEQIEAVGKKFDPLLHEAITQRAEDDKEDNIVLEENQRGYKLAGRVIRPSKVIVNKLKAGNIQPGAENQERQQSEGQNNQQDETTDVE